MIIEAYEFNRLLRMTRGRIRRRDSARPELVEGDEQATLSKRPAGLASECEAHPGLVTGTAKSPLYLWHVT